MVDPLVVRILTIMQKINDLCLSGNVGQKELVMWHREFNHFYKIANDEQQGAYHELWFEYLMNGRD